MLLIFFFLSSYAENTARYDIFLIFVSFLMPIKNWDFLLKKPLPTKQLEQRTAGSGKAYSFSQKIHKIKTHILIKPHSKNLTKSKLVKLEI